MSKSFDELAVFSSLKPLLVPFEKNLTVVTDDETSYYLDTRHIMKNKKPLFFGAVQIKKNYVSFHLMPVYVNPSLLDSMSAELGKRMQGKSCFNFKNVDHNLIKELKALTQAGYQFYVEENYI
tara:strand:- start:18274 stop:18642 length:369 start_codon:yes stop_codon:yes gene_type:complete